MSQDKDNKTPPEYTPSAPGDAAAPGDEPVLAASGPEAPAEAPADAVSPSEVAHSDHSEHDGGSGFPWLATLALLLVMALGAGGGWLVLEAQRRETALLDRMRLLESVTERELMDTGEQQAQLRQFSSQLEDELQGELSQGLSQLAPQLSSQSSRLQELAGQLEEIDSQVDRQGDELARLRATDRESWQLAEVEYLLRLANQRLILTGDIVSAQALLRSADGVLEQLEDPGLHAVRGAVAADLSALRSVPRLDIEGLYLRLSALSEQAAALSIFELPEPEPRLEPERAGDWQGRLQQGYQAALQKLSDYIIIRRRDVPVQALMDPQWEGLVRQNLRMLLEQAQVALLSGQARLYRESLARARQWVAQFFVSDERQARALDGELERLAGESVSREMPDISRSLQALEQAMDARRQAAAAAGD